MTQTIEEKDKSIAPVSSGDKDSAAQHSWGEAHKEGVYKFIRNIGINYVINFIISAAITFAFDTSPWGKKFRTWSAQKSTDLYDNLKIDKTFSSFMMNFAVRTQFILSGGHLLLLPVTYMKNHRKRFEFGIGHKLDQLQNFVGMGTEATKRSIEEYSHVKDLLKVNDPSSLTEEDKQLLANNHIKPDLTFDDHKQPLHHVLKARLTGMAFTTTISALLAFTSLERFPNWLKFEKNFEHPVGKWLGDNVMARIPGISRLFNRAEVKADIITAADRAKGIKPLTGHQLYGIYFIDDMIFTLASQLGFQLTEHHHDKIQNAKYAAEASQQETSSEPQAAPDSTQPPSKGAVARVMESRAANYSATPQI